MPTTYYFDYRCKKCGLFVRTQLGLYPGETYTFFCAKGHPVSYRVPMTIFVQGYEDLETGFVGNDKNSGLSQYVPLKTITEALNRCENIRDSIILEGDI